jgi:hypothetical protein
MSHVKSLIIIISQMSVFGGDDNKYVINKHFDKLSLSNLEDSKICEVGHF